MKKLNSNLKKIIGACALAALAGGLSAFNWPQHEIMSDSFFSYFGQLRGGMLSASLVFGESAEVRAVDSGRVTVVLSEHGTSNWFDSTLGNAVVVSHADNLLSVYGNLDAETLSEGLFSLGEVEKGAVFGESGNSGWQNGQSCLEFQVSDTKNRAVINPRVMMPRIGNELPVALNSLSVISKSGEIYDFSKARNIPAGTYLLYRERQSVSMPYKISVFMNGALVDTSSYETLRQSDGRICVAGKSLYPVEKVYPSESRHLLGEINVTRGHCTVSVVATDVLGKESAITYNFDAY